MNNSFSNNFNQFFYYQNFGTNYNQNINYNHNNNSNQSYYNNISFNNQNNPNNINPDINRNINQNNISINYHYLGGGYYNNSNNNNGSQNIYFNNFINRLEDQNPNMCNKYINHLGVIPENNHFFQNNANNQLFNYSPSPQNNQAFQNSMNNNFNNNLGFLNSKTNYGGNSNNLINNNIMNNRINNNNLRSSSFIQNYQNNMNNNNINNNQINYLNGYSGNMNINNLNILNSRNNIGMNNQNNLYQRNNNQILNNFTNYVVNNNNNMSNNNINNNNNNNFNPKRDINKIIRKEEGDIELGFYVCAKGLENVGATCYMNATLQCFYHVKLLTEKLLNDEDINKSMEITYCYKNLLKKLVGFKDKKRFRKEKMELFTIDQKEKPYVKPEEFKDLISKKNPLFKGIKANDSKDLIIFLLENMDNELTKRNNKGVKEIFFGKKIQELEEENFKKSHNSIFADLFYGFQKSVMICKNCQYEDQTFTVFNFIIFPLEKTYNSLKKNQNNNNIHSNLYNQFGFGINLNMLNSPTDVSSIKRKLTLEECFKENEDEELLTGSNQIYCNHCHQNSNALTKNEIYLAPNVLILIINRGKGNYFKCDLDFPKTLDISQFTSNPNSPKIYNLIGVISHIGESSMEGHFIAYCRHFDFNWYLFNDATATQVPDDEMYKGTPYILFYQNSELDKETKNFN